MLIVFLGLKIAALLYVHHNVTIYYAHAVFYLTHLEFERDICKIGETL